MIIKELRAEVTAAIAQYISKYRALNHVPIDRRNNIHVIKTFLKGDNPITIRRNLLRYIDSLVIPFLSFINIFDVHQFVSLIREVLEQKKFREVNMLQAMLIEKDQVIAGLKNRQQHGRGEIIESRFKTIVTELKLLRDENNYLYQTIEALDKKVSQIESESKLYLERARLAEEELKQLKQSIAKSTQNYTMIPEPVCGEKNNFCP